VIDVHMSGPADDGSAAWVERTADDLAEPLAAVVDAAEVVATAEHDAAAGRP